MLARLPLFVRTYKYLYVGMLATNLLLTMTGNRLVNFPKADRRDIYVINVVTLGLNIISWCGYVYRFRWGFISERALSFGRMLVTIIAGPLLLIDIVFYSPVFLLVWNPVIALSEVARRSPEWALLPVWLPASAALLMAEGLYWWEIGATQAVHEQKTASTRTERCRASTARP